MSNEGFISLEKFEKKKKIGKGNFGKVYKVEEISTKQIYAAKIALNKIDKNSSQEMLNISREVNIISRLEHPSILKFIGYSPIDFNKKQKPVIITEFSINGSLGELLELERMKKKIKGWDDTKKLICIYGIAKGMAYLHSHDIIHRDLKPDNIFLDDFLFPKIAVYGRPCLAQPTTTPRAPAPGPHSKSCIVRVFKKFYSEKVSHSKSSVLKRTF